MDGQGSWAGPGCADPREVASVNDRSEPPESTQTGNTRGVNVLRKADATAIRVVGYAESGA